jgi:hypothetical protein
MTPWKEKREIGNATLYLGDCLEILPHLPKVDAVITDPVWPNTKPGLYAGTDDPLGLFTAMWKAIQIPARAVIWMRNDSDPRFLVPVPLPFRQVMWLRYAAVGYLGRFMTGNDVAYAFGAWPTSRPNARVLPAIGPVQTVSLKGSVMHPTPRSVNHARWLVEFWGEKSVIDPFMGSGTVGIACVQLGRPFMGIEIDEVYFVEACERIENAQRQERLFA